jgi:upstream activation factor subunit UAF30
MAVTKGQKKAKTEGEKVDVEKPVKQAKAPKQKAAPVVEVPTTSTSVPENEVLPVNVESSIGDMFSHLNKSLHELSAHLATLRAEVRTLEKNVGKEVRQLDKINAKKNKNKGSRAPSGFVKPTKISNELADFLGRERGSLMARTDVTKQMTEYIRKNSLQDKVNGRIILPDGKLKKLLKLGDADSLTYFNLQKFMGPHFEKSVPVVA